MATAIIVASICLVLSVFIVTAYKSARAGAAEAHEAALLKDGFIKVYVTSVEETEGEESAGSWQWRKDPNAVQQGDHT